MRPARGKKRKVSKVKDDTDSSGNTKKPFIPDDTTTHNGAASPEAKQLSVESEPSAKGSSPPPRVASEPENPTASELHAVKHADDKTENVVEETELRERQTNKKNTEREMKTSDSLSLNKLEKDTLTGLKSNILSTENVHVPEVRLKENDSPVKLTCNLSQETACIAVSNSGKGERSATCFDPFVRKDSHDRFLSASQPVVSGRRDEVCHVSEKFAKRFKPPPKQVHGAEVGADSHSCPTIEEDIFNGKTTSKKTDTFPYNKVTGNKKDVNEEKRIDTHEDLLPQVKTTKTVSAITTDPVKADTPICNIANGSHRIEPEGLIQTCQNNVTENLADRGDNPYEASKQTHQQIVSEADDCHNSDYDTERKDHHSEIREHTDNMKEPDTRHTNEFGDTEGIHCRPEVIKYRNSGSRTEVEENSVEIPTSLTGQRSLQLPNNNEDHNTESIIEKTEMVTEKDQSISISPLGLSKIPPVTSPMQTQRFVTTGDPKAGVSSDEESDDNDVESICITRRHSHPAGGDGSVNCEVPIQDTAIFTEQTNTSERPGSIVESLSFSPMVACDGANQDNTNTKTQSSSIMTGSRSFDADANPTNITGKERSDTTTTTSNETTKPFVQGNTGDDTERLNSDVAADENSDTETQMPLSSLSKEENNITFTIRCPDTETKPSKHNACAVQNNLFDNVADTTSKVWTEQIASVKESVGEQDGIARQDKTVDTKVKTGHIEDSLSSRLREQNKDVNNESSLWKHSDDKGEETQDTQWVGCIGLADTSVNEHDENMKDSNDKDLANGKNKEEVTLRMEETESMRETTLSTGASTAGHSPLNEDSGCTNTVLPDASDSEYIPVIPGDTSTNHITNTGSQHNGKSQISLDVYRVGRPLTENTLEEPLYDKGVGGLVNEKKEPSVTAMTQLYALPPDTDPPQAGSLTKQSPSAYFSDTQPDAEEMNLCDFNTQDFQFEESIDAETSADTTIDDFEHACQRAQDDLHREVSARKAEGASIVTSILGDLMLMNKQLMRMKREMDVVSRTIGRVASKQDGAAGLKAGRGRGRYM